LTNISTSNKFKDLRSASNKLSCFFYCPYPS